MAPVTHIVMFEFKPDVTKAQRQELSDEVLDLQKKCVHASTKKPYMLSSCGGTDNSIEGLQNGLSHVFVMEFASAQDREYYVNDDPHHLAFKKKIFPLLVKPVVVDFTAGEFKH